MKSKNIALLWQSYWISFNNDCPAYLNFIGSLEKKNQAPQAKIKTFGASANLRYENVSYRAVITVGIPNRIAEVTLPSQTAPREIRFSWRILPLLGQHEHVRSAGSNNNYNLNEVQSLNDICEIKDRISQFRKIKTELINAGSQLEQLRVWF